MKTLRESLLDADLLDKSVDTVVLQGWLNNHSTSKVKTHVTKIGLEVRGNIIIRDCDNIPPLGICRLYGDLFIENSSCPNPDGLFTEYATVEGNINVTGCQNISGLGWLPRYVDTLSVFNCPAIKSLDGINCFADTVSIMKCGKKFKESAIRAAFKGTGQVFCAAEGEVATIVESFNDPIITRLYKQLQDEKLEYEVESMISGSVRLDKILPSMRTTFSVEDNDKAIKAARKIVANRNADHGFIVTEDYDGKFIDLYNSGKVHYKLLKARYGNAPEHLNKVNDILGRLYIGSSGMDNIKYIHIWNLATSGISYRYEINAERRKARDGMIDPHDTEQMRRILREQQSRYKRTVAAIKAERGSERYKKVTAQVEALMNRFTKFMSRIISDPSWASGQSYKIEAVFNAFRKGYEPGSKVQPEYGLLYSFQNWSRRIIQVLSKDELTYGNEVEYAKALQKAMERADFRLKQVGM